MTRYGRLGAALVLAAVGATCAIADTLELANGETLKDCYVRDEGTQVSYWANIKDVGQPPQVLPRSKVKGWKVERDDAWDAKPALADLTVTFIEVTPKLAGLHGVVNYDEFGRPWLDASRSKALVDVGDDKFVKPEEAAAKLKLQYKPGEQLTLTAHVKNLGFKTAAPFKLAWLIDGKPVAEAACDKALAELEETTFEHKYAWQAGLHDVTVRIVTDQPEITQINNTATDALWAFPFTYVVANGRIKAWHEFRSAYGTFSFEDFYRWHLDIMNRLLVDAVYPAAPEGCQARVRLDKIIYADSVKGHEPYYNGQLKTRFNENGIRYDQGGWGWDDNEQELKTGVWQQTDKAWRNQTEWSLPHELGHQLGLVDWYAVDCDGTDAHKWADSDKRVTHFMRYPVQMMHWHGPQPFGEVDSAYLTMTIDKPRGYFGDYYFANPKEVFLLVTDINGRPLVNADVELFQRGVKVLKEGGEQQGVRYFDVVEDGDFYGPPVSAEPVIVGQTGGDGLLRLPNRPAKEVRTLNGFHRTDNPFGNMNVVGPRNLMLIKVTHDGQPAYFWLEGHDVLVAWMRGQKDKYIHPVQTPFGSVDSPPAPADVTVTRVDEHHVKVTWQPPVQREQNYLDHVIGYRVWRRIGNDGLDDRPWFPVATLGPKATEFTVDLREFPDDVYWFDGPKTQRFGVTSLAALSLQSELVGALLK